MSKTTAFSSISSLQIVIFLFFTILHSHHVHSHIDNSTNAEKTILLKLKEHWLNPPFLDPWIPSSNHCTWPGISCIGGLVRYIFLYSKDINQTISPLICDLKNLSYIDLHSNHIPGPFPTSLRLLSPHLKYLDLGYNGFKGSIPAAIGNMTVLEHLDLSANGFTGSVPSGLFQRKKLRILYLQENHLSGSLPQSMEALNLEEIDMHNNDLTGTIPDDFGKLKKLKRLDLSSNQLSGQIPTQLAALPYLSMINLGYNRLSGDFPASISSCESLSEIKFPANQLSGQIPSKIGSLSRLSHLDLSENEFSGEIPPRIRDLPISYLDLSYNKFSGEIGDLSILHHLDLSHNKFSGDIGNLSIRHHLDLSHNEFSGEIPPETFSFSGLSYLKFSDNQFSGEIPHGIWNLTNLFYLDLSANKFFGEIPPDIRNLSSLQHLDLSDNKFSGKIPPEIWSLSSLVYLDLSKNQFSGEIPYEIWLPNPYFVNLSSNLLCGSIPGRFKYSSSVNISNNPDHCKSKPPLSKNRFVAIFSAAGVAVLLTMYILRRYTLKRYKLESTWKLIPFQKLDFTESTILSSLIENNLIGYGGSGNVYRVQVNSSKEYVAVKRIRNKKKMDERLKKQFLAEVQILGTIRHLNILKLMCCISSQNSKLLVYEYMENGSLDQWLHCKMRPSTVSSSLSLQNAVLEWPKRLQIAVGAAQGLCYMHHCNSSPIIHRDLKSSNILLDSKFNAKIADFGLARILESDGDPSTMSVVAGTFGYIAPEYAQTTRVNEKVDVYSFGVILLELVTGRKAHQGDENSSLAEWAWRHIQQENPIVDALDEEIRGPNYLDEMIKVFKLGIYCTHTLPSSRPTMMEVQQILHLCAHPLAPEENTLVPVRINSIPLTRTIVFSLRTFTEVSNSRVND